MTVIPTTSLPFTNDQEGLTITFKDENNETVVPTFAAIANHLKFTGTDGNDSIVPKMVNKGSYVLATSDDEETDYFTLNPAEGSYTLVSDSDVSVQSISWTAIEWV